ncbi:MAG: zinc-dependent alcohol dehydrogenase [Candidatus Limnocylindria bacterium]
MTGSATDDPSVRGVRLRVAASAVNHRALQLFGRVVPRLAGGRMPWLTLDRYERPALPGPAWARLRPILSGICGTDLSLLTGRASAVLSPFASFPAVLGHEVVGAVEEAGADAGVAVGQRVVLDPVISCHVRGLEPCEACVGGAARFCRRAADGPMAPGMLIGYCHDLPGGWSESMLAHASQLHAVPSTLPDEVALLVEPFAVALHAVLAEPPEDGNRVLVVGGGSVGLCTLAALRLAAPGAEVAIVVRHDAQADLASRLGAHHVVRDQDGRGAERAAVTLVGALPHRPLVGPSVLVGGFEQVYDCVGSRSSLAASLRVASPGGRVVLVGGPAEIERLDLTLAWTRELRVHGTYVYGREASVAGAPHTFDHAMGLLAAHPELPLGELVTHRFGLEDWRQALATALGRRAHGSLKVAFAPGMDAHT